LSGGGYSILESAFAKSRTRSSWNDWLAHAERPASDHEETKIQRAAATVTGLITNHAPLVATNGKIVPQGSYYNNTNVRLEADMDLRFHLPGIKTVYAAGVDEQAADAALGYSATGPGFQQTLTEVRRELGKILIAKFGSANVDTTGAKAITVAGLESRADCDIVPTFSLHYIEHIVPTGEFFTTKGSCILGQGGLWTFNFPEQHYANGVAKRGRTKHRFKRNVRMLKRLNYELEAISAILKRLPSFLIECLVYVVDDDLFLDDNNDRFGRLLNILMRIHHLLGDQNWVHGATEINEVKFLFREGQAWTVDEAQSLVLAAINRLVA
jgi:hypothetical protein